MSQAGAWTQTISGVNLGQGYSGNVSGSFSNSYNTSSTSTWSEQGSYANGSFNLTMFSYSDVGNDSSSGQQSDSSNWSGGYSGSGNANASELGSGYWTITLSGNYSGGQGKGVGTCGSCRTVTAAAATIY